MIGSVYVGIGWWPHVGKASMKHTSLTAKAAIYTPQRTHTLNVTCNISVNSAIGANDCTSIYINQSINPDKTSCRYHTLFVYI